MCRNGQKRPKLRTGPHATTKEGTNMDVHELGRFRVPSRPTARRSGVTWHLRKTKLKDFYGITLLIPSAVIGHIQYAAYAASYAHLPDARACLPSRTVDLSLTKHLPYALRITLPHDLTPLCLGVRRSKRCA